MPVLVGTPLYLCSLQYMLCTNIGISVLSQYERRQNEARDKENVEATSESDVENENSFANPSALQMKQQVEESIDVVSCLSV